MKLNKFASNKFQTYFVISNTNKNSLKALCFTDGCMSENKKYNTTNEHFYRILTL